MINCIIVKRYDEIPRVLLIWMTVGATITLIALIGCLHTISKAVEFSNDIILRCKNTTRCVYSRQKTVQFRIDAKVMCLQVKSLTELRIRYGKFKYINHGFVAGYVQGIRDRTVDMLMVF